MKKSYNWFTKTKENVSFRIDFFKASPMYFTGSNAFNKALKKYFETPESKRFSLNIEVPVNRFPRSFSRSYPIIRRDPDIEADQINPDFIKKIGNIDISNWVKKAENALKASYDPSQTYIERIIIQMENYSENSPNKYFMTPLLVENLKKLYSITEKEYDLIDLIRGTKINEIAKNTIENIEYLQNDPVFSITPSFDNWLYNKDVYNIFKIIETELEEQPIREDLETIREKISFRQGFTPEKDLLKKIYDTMFYYNDYVHDQLSDYIFPDYIEIHDVLDYMDNPSYWYDNYRFDPRQDFIEFQDKVEYIASLISSEKEAHMKGSIEEIQHPDQTYLDKISIQLRDNGLQMTDSLKTNFESLYSVTGKEYSLHDLADLKNNNIDFGAGHEFAEEIYQECQQQEIERIQTLNLECIEEAEVCI